MKIKDNDLFLRTLQLEEDYIFNRIKNCLTSLSAIPEDSQPEFKATLETIYKTEISTLFSLARWRLSVVESEPWKESVLVEASKVLFKKEFVASVPDAISSSNQPQATKE